MEAPQTTAQQVLQIVHETGGVRARDLTARGLSPTHLQRLYEQGLILRSGRGVYLPADTEISENSSLAEVALRIPAGVVCLLSALQFHGLTTQSPHQVWITLPLRAHTPRQGYPPVASCICPGKHSQKASKQPRSDASSCASGFLLKTFRRLFADFSQTFRRL